MPKKRLHTEHAEARALEDAAWDVKGAAERFHGREMTAESRIVLASAARDLQRIKDRVEAEWERRIATRQRKNVTTPATGEQTTLGGVDG